MWPKASLRRRWRNQSPSDSLCPGAAQPAPANGQHPMSEEHTMIRNVETYTVFSRLFSLLLIGDFRMYRGMRHLDNPGRSPFMLFPLSCRAGAFEVGFGGGPWSERNEQRANALRIVRGGWVESLKSQGRLTY